MNLKTTLKWIIIAAAVIFGVYLFYIYAWPWVKKNVVSRITSAIGGATGSTGITGTPAPLKLNESTYYGRYKNWTIWHVQKDDGSVTYWGQEDGVTSDQSSNGIGVTPEGTLADTLSKIDSGTYNI